MDVYLMNTDGTGPIRLTESEAEDHQPAWSPDGSRIAFSSTRSGGPPHTDGHIYVVNADGTEQRRLVFDLSSAGSPAWSPDGARIAFAGCCSPGWDIYVINADGTGLRQLTSDEVFDNDPAWSPDASRIVFSRDDDGTGPKLPSHGLYLINADGTGLRQLTRGYGGQPAWSPDGTRIAFARFGDAQGIDLLDLSTGDEIRLTEEQDTQPAWSPDGATIAFTSYRVNGEGDIFVMQADGSDQIQITGNPFGDYDPAWQPSTSVSGPSPTPSPSYLSVDERWSPPTYREDDRVVMPVTFPDGTIAELVYPAELRLEGLSAYPDTFADGGPRVCGWSVHGTRYDPHIGWIRGDAPLAEHVRQDGRVVALWEGTRDNEPHNFLVYRFGSWSVLVPCSGDVDQEALAVWAENLHGSQSPDGLLVLEGTPPLVLHPWRDQNGPTLRMSGQDVVIDLRPLSDQCDPASGWGGDTDPGDGVVQWCVQPEGGIYVYANGFTREGKDFLRRLVDDLEVRRVQPGE